MFEVDLEEFRVRCEDAGITPVLVAGTDGWHRVAIEGCAHDLASFLLTVAPHLDDHFETVSRELDFREQWLAVDETEPTVETGRRDHRYVFRNIRPVRDLNFALQR